MLLKPGTIRKPSLLEKFKQENQEKEKERQKEEEYVINRQACFRKQREEQQKQGQNTLLSDKYEPFFPPVRLLVRKTPSKSNSAKMVKHYIEVSVKRFDNNENAPMVHIQMYQESENGYTGYLKKKKKKKKCTPSPGNAVRFHRYSVGHL